MTELSGFSAIQPVAQIAPQALKVPASKAEAIERASEVFAGLWDAVEHGLSPVVKIIIHKHPQGYVFCDITPFDTDGVKDNGVALPGHFIAVDGSKLRALTQAELGALVGEPLPEPQPEPEDEPPPA
jgi:hypothetical protein